MNRLLLLFIGAALGMECPPFQPCDELTQMSCFPPAPPNMVHCPPPPLCIPKKMAGSRKAGSLELCDNQCPHTCPPNQVPCPMIFDVHGCPHNQCAESPDHCPASVYDHKGCSAAPVCDQPCEVGQVLCPATFDHMGCPEPCACVDADKVQNCPVSGFDERGCPPPMDYGVCQGNDCVVKCPNRYDGKGCEIGTPCPENKDEHCLRSEFDVVGCPIFPPEAYLMDCPQDQQLCQLTNPMTGCQMPPSCEFNCPASAY